MANTTFSGPVRSENGFKNIIKNSTTGALTNEMTLSTYTATIEPAATGTDHKESSIGIPSNFIPMGVAITVTSAAANNVNLQDIGTDDDPVIVLDGYRVCVDTHVTGFLVKACKWNAKEEICFEGEEMLTLNTKGGKNF